MNVWIALGGLAVIILALSYAPAVIGSTSCPKSVQGDGEKEIKYFSSPFCAACWIQKPALEEIMEVKGGEFTLKEYNVDFCRDDASPHFILGVPAFIIDDTVVYGLQTTKQLKEMLG